MKEEVKYIIKTRESNPKVQELLNYCKKGDLHNIIIKTGRVPFVTAEIKTKLSMEELDLKLPAPKLTNC